MINFTLHSDIRNYLATGVISRNIRCSLRHIVLTAALFLCAISDSNSQCGQAELISNPANSSANPQVSCDGNTIVWREFIGGIGQVFKNGARISNPANPSFNPQVSCDGNTVVWTENVGGIFQVFRNGALISNPTNRAGGPQVSCDGNTVVWIETVGGFSQVFKNGALISNPANEAFNLQVSCALFLFANPIIHKSYPS